MQRLWRNLKWPSGIMWSAYASLIFVCNLVGVMIVGSFLGVLLPPNQGTHLPRLANGVIYGLAGYPVLATIAGIGTTWILFKPLLKWQRCSELYDLRWVRYLVMRVLTYQALLGMVIWSLGVIVFSAVMFAYDSKIGMMVLITSALGGAIVALLTYLIAEHMVRSVVVEVLARRAPNFSLEPPTGHRLHQTWVLTSNVPVVATLLVPPGQRRGMFTDGAADLLPTITALAILALITGYFGTMLTSMSIVDSIRGLTGTINEVCQGQVDTRVSIYDGSEMGVPQAGFNEMMRGSQGRQRVRDLFGRYAGSEVARKALEEKLTLGDENRLVAVLFVDVIGLTDFVGKNSPGVVVRELNVFSGHVVDCVHRNKDIINKLQSDAALAVFNALLPLDDMAGHALIAARELREELFDLRLSADIDVSADHVVVGHIGARDRFEYMVIGDAINQTARLTELAKDIPGRVLVTVSIIRLASEDEQARRTTLKSVELRGHMHMAQLARPVCLTFADEA